MHFKYIKNRRLAGEKKEWQKKIAKDTKQLGPRRKFRIFSISLFFVYVNSKDYWSLCNQSNHNREDAMVVENSLVYSQLKLTRPVSGAPTTF